MRGYGLGAETVCEGTDRVERGQVEALAGSVDAPERRPEGDHVHVGELLREETALESRMDGADHRFAAEETLV